MACFWSKLAHFGYNYRVRSDPAASSSGASAAGPGQLSRPGRGAEARAQLWRFAALLGSSTAVVVVIGMLRLARQFPAAAQSPSLLVPFVLPVIALALEAGAFVALSGAQVSALIALPPGGLARRARRTALSFFATLAVLLAAQLVPRGTEHPGTFANELIQSAIGSCGESGDVPVPLLGLRVRCGAPRRIMGPMPGVRGVEVAMSSLVFSDDLRRVEIRELDLDAKRSLSVHLSAGRASIAGIAPWSRSTRLDARFRSAVLALLALSLWSSGMLIERRVSGDGRAPVSAGARWLVWALAGLPGAAAAAGFIVVDQSPGTPWAYLAPAASGLLGMVLLRLLVRRLPQMFSSFGAF